MSSPRPADPVMTGRSRLPSDGGEPTGSATFDLRQTRLGAGRSLAEGRGQQVPISSPRWRSAIIALAVIALTFALGDVSKAAASSSSNAARGHQAATHKTPLPSRTTQTPVQKAATRALENLAAQIIADYAEAKNSRPYQGVAYGEHEAEPEFAGRDGFQVVYPLGTNIIVNNGKTENVGTGDYVVSAVFSYPRNDKYAPSKPNLANLIDISISEAEPSSSGPESVPVGYGYGPGYRHGASYSFIAEGNTSPSTTDRWDLLQSIDLQSTPVDEGAIAAEADWDYTTATGSQGVNKGSAVSFSPLNSSLLKAEVGEAQRLLNNARQYLVTPITPAVVADFPPPSAHRCFDLSGATASCHEEEVAAAKEHEAEAAKKKSEEEAVGAPGSLVCPASGLQYPAIPAGDLVTEVSGACVRFSPPADGLITCGYPVYVTVPAGYVVTEVFAYGSGLTPGKCGLVYQNQGFNAVRIQHPANNMIVCSEVIAPAFPAGYIVTEVFAYGTGLTSGKCGYVFSNVGYNADKIIHPFNGAIMCDSTGVAYVPSGYVVTEQLDEGGTGLSAGKCGFLFENVGYNAVRLGLAPEGKNASLATTSAIASRRGTLAVTATCPRSAKTCTGHLTLQSARAVSASLSASMATNRTAAGLTLASGSFKIAGGDAATVKMHLTAKASNLLLRVHVIHAQATLTVRDPASHTIHATVTIRAAKSTSGHKRSTKSPAQR